VCNISNTDIVEGLGFGVWGLGSVTSTERVFLNMDRLSCLSWILTRCRSLADIVPDMADTNLISLNTCSDDSLSQSDGERERKRAGRAGLLRHECMDV